MILYRLQQKTETLEQNDLTKLALEGYKHWNEKKMTGVLYDNHHQQTLFEYRLLHDNEVENAFLLAVEHHKTQKRKCKIRPYIEHPLRVCTIASMIDRSPILKAAALGHDLLEDTTCSEKEIEKKCGSKTLEIIQYVSENKKTKDWFQRKKEYIQNVNKGSPLAQKLCLADKIANIESLYKQHHTEGDLVWKRFNQSKEAKQWFENEVLQMLKTKNHIEKKWLHAYQSMIKNLYR